MGRRVKVFLFSFTHPAFTPWINTRITSVVKTGSDVENFLVWTTCCQSSSTIRGQVVKKQSRTHGARKANQLWREKIPYLTNGLRAWMLFSFSFFSASRRASSLSTSAITTASSSFSHTRRTVLLLTRVKVASSTATKKREKSIESKNRPLWGEDYFWKTAKKAGRFSRKNQLKKTRFFPWSDVHHANKFLSLFLIRIKKNFDFCSFFGLDGIRTHVCQRSAWSRPVSCASPSRPVARRPPALWCPAQIPASKCRQPSVNKQKDTPIKAKVQKVNEKKKNFCIDAYRGVMADASSLPSAVIPTGIRLVDLKSVMPVPAHVNKGHAKRPHALKINGKLPWRATNGICEKKTNYDHKAKDAHIHVAPSLNRWLTPRP